MLTAGDVVTLKCGGPKMTVEMIGEHPAMSGEEKVCCAWFDGTKLKNAWFFEATLIKVISP